MFYEFLSKIVGRLFPEPDTLVDESKIEITLARHSYDTSYQYHRIYFIVINHNERPTQNSQLHIAIKGIKDQARIPWYWRGIDDKGGSYHKTVEQMHLENGSPHTALLFMRVESAISTIENLGDHILTDTSTLLVPLGKFDFKISVVGLNHKRRDEFFTIDIVDRETMSIMESGSSF